MSWSKGRRIESIIFVLIKKTLKSVALKHHNLKLGLYWAFPILVTYLSSYFLNIFIINSLVITFIKFRYNNIFNFSKVSKYMLSNYTGERFAVIKITIEKRWTLTWLLIFTGFTVANKWMMNLFRSYSSWDKWKQVPDGMQQ